MGIGSARFLLGMGADFVGIGRSLLLFRVRAYDVRTQRANALLLPRMGAGKMTAGDVAAFGVTALGVTAVQMRTQRANPPLLPCVSARVMTAGKMGPGREGACGMGTGRVSAPHMTAGRVSAPHMTAGRVAAFRKTPPLMRVDGRIKRTGKRRGGES